MNDFVIARISLVLAVLSLLVLMGFASFYEPKELSVGEIDEYYIGESVKVKGKIAWFMDKQSFILFTLKDKEDIMGIIFNPTLQQRDNFSPGAFVEITGRIEKYKGNLEIIADKIKTIELFN